ncbi:MAG TPA: DUF2127 domain-containing protein [Pyrinomonadaceae bacterium]
MKKKKKKTPRQGSRDKGIFLIAIFKLFKAALLVAAAIGAFSLLHKNVADAMMSLLNTLHVDHDNNYLHGLVMKMGLLDDRKRKEIGAGSFFYAAMLGTEGVGLLLEKHWAEYLTVIATALLIPLEIYELAKHASIGKVIVLIINVAVVVYLIYRLRHDTKHGKFRQSSVKARG